MASASAARLPADFHCCGLVGMIGDLQGRYLESASAGSARKRVIFRTTDYATVLFPIPGICNDLEVVRLL
jgi:hypothetical protein